MRTPTMHTLFLLMAFVCFVLAVVGVPKVNWIALGLALWVLSLLVPAA